MKIPRDPVERKQLYDQLTRQCMASRRDRFEFYKILRNFYLFGTSDETGAPHNKIGSTVDTLTSFIYSPDAVRFALNLGNAATETDMFMSIPLAKELAEQWRMSRTHLLFGLGVKWALVFGVMLMKVQWRRSHVRSHLVEPHQFGVLREDVIELADQEAFAMFYTVTRTQLNTDLIGNPRRDSIMARVGKGASDTAVGMSGGLNRLILSNPVGGVLGSIAKQSGTAGGAPDQGLGGPGGQYNYSPKVEAELLDMVDLYVYDDDIEDYQIVTIASPDVVIYDRPQRVMGVAGIPHFVTIRPEINLYDYFWGDSFVARLAWLQDWRSRRIGQIDDLLSVNADPPISAVGMGGIQDEKLLALQRAGGRLSVPVPGGKVEVHQREVPQDMFREVDKIDAMFDDTAGIGHILQGKGESGVRSRGQADLMARLGSARPKNRALIAEESAEDAATLILRTVQEASDQRFTAENPATKQKLTFVAAQFTKDYEIKVDAHSASPIFVEDKKAEAVQLLEAKAIDRETFLELFDPPNLQLLKHKLKLIQAKEAEVARMQQQLEAKKD